MRGRVGLRLRSFVRRGALAPGGGRGLDIPKLALHEPPFIVDDSRPPVPDDLVERLDALMEAGKRGEAVAAFMTDSVGMPAEAIPAMRENPSWARMEAVANTLSYDSRIMADTLRGDPSPLIDGRR